MTGIGGFVLDPPAVHRQRWTRFLRRVRRILGHKDAAVPFVVLCYPRTGSNWLCGMLYQHPEILMHNEVFNENCVHAYYKEDFQRNHWDYENRDVDPEGLWILSSTVDTSPKSRSKPSDTRAFRTIINRDQFLSLPWTKFINDAFWKILMF
jgi:hypothetical protein